MVWGGGGGRGSGATIGRRHLSTLSPLRNFSKRFDERIENRAERSERETTKESFEWRFYGRATPLFNVENEHKGRRTWRKTALSTDRSRIRDKTIPSPREETDSSKG